MIDQATCRTNNWRQCYSYNSEGGLETEEGEKGSTQSSTNRCEKNPDCFVKNIDMTKGAGNFNGLLLASVGNRTTLENIMVSHSAGNSFEVWGGGVYLEKAVSYKSDKNDFKFNYGAQCQR